MTKTLANVHYICRPISRRKTALKSIEPIGLDTEAYTTGECFMIATSLGDVFTLEEFPRCFFTRKYIQKHFVAYNLSYDEGALLQKLPTSALEALRQGYKIEHEGYTWSIIPKKCLTIRRKYHSIHIYDMYNFYTHSLDYNAEKYLGENKLEVETKSFTPEYVKDHWSDIAKYCVHDAELVARLAERLIGKFEEMGVYPRKLYSTAYMSYQYFKQNTKYVTVDWLWKHDRKVIDYAMQSYNGGKFEVTSRGPGYFYEYDIVSAYPAEIADLVNISFCRVVWGKKYRKTAVYGFLRCRVNIPFSVSSPVALKYGTVNIYPCGEYEKIITLQEYDYLVKYGADCTIIDACWFIPNRKDYPYRKAIRKLVKLKQQFKSEGADLEYHTVKIFLNSLYGKFVQLINKRDYWSASTCWNPVYGSVITANTRIKISEMQTVNPDIVAVHTDSVISTKKLQVPERGTLGDLLYETEGTGVIVGSGIYQVGAKSKIRGFVSRTPLLDMIDTPRKSINIKETHAFTWKEVTFHGWDRNMINRFQEVDKQINVNFDRKRVWLNNASSFRDLARRSIESIPLHVDGLFL